MRGDRLCKTSEMKSCVVHQKEQSTSGGKHDILKCWAKEKNLCSSLLNGYMWGKIASVKARGKVASVTETEDDNSLYKSFSFGKGKKRS